MKKALNLLITVVLSQTIAHAAPSISNVSGTPGHDQTITINGSGFDSKSSASPLIWDNVEGGQFSSNWGDVKDLTVTNSGQRHSRSSRSGFLNFNEADWDGDFQTRNNTYQKWFVQYWFKLDSNWDWGTTTFDGSNRFLSNLKIFRMWNPGDINENFVVAINGWENQAEYVMENVGGEPRRTFMSNIRSRMTTGTWHLLQFEYTENSSVGASDGQFRCWLDGSLMAEQTNLKTRENYSEFKRPFIIGFSNVWETGGGATDRAPNYFYIDDVYVDNTWSRVEIGDRSTYDSCTVREIQPVTSWAGSAVQVRVNAGKFNSGDTAYMYVTDVNGNVNSTGFPIVIGQSGGGGPVNQPPQISISIPSTNASFTTTAGLASILVSGIASDDVQPTNVTWSNSQGGSGTASNTSGDWRSWSINALPLVAGAVNVVTVTVRDGSGATATDSISITVPALPVNQAPQVAITVPTTNSNHTSTAGQSSIQISGTASDDVSLSAVTWVNDRGGSGTASNTSGDWRNWSIANLSLQAGVVNTVTITARDGAGVTNTDQIAITVPAAPVNQPPQIVISIPTTSSNYTASAGQASVQISGTASDDVRPTNVSWVNNRGGSGTASNTSGDWRSWSIGSVPLVIGVVNTVTVTVTDGSGATSTDQIVITVPAAPVNQPPQITITAPSSAASFTASAGLTTIVVSGSATDDGSLTNIMWSNDRGGSGSASNVSGDWRSWRIPSVPLQPGITNNVTVVVTDGSGATSTDQIAIVVPAVPPTNRAPTVSAGGDQNVLLPAAANLSGSAQDDGIPNSPPRLAMSWSKISGPGDVSFTNASSFQTPAYFTAAGNYVLRLTVTDGQMSSSDDLAVAVSASAVNNQSRGRTGTRQTLVKPTSNQNAEIEYEVKEPGNVKVVVSNRFGQEVKVLENNYKEAGVYEVVWDGRSNNGNMASSGVYVVQIDSTGKSVKEKVVLIK